MTLIELFWSKTKADGNCVVWTGARLSGPRPYGRFRGRPAHRWIYEQEHGAVPSNLDVMHSCDNPPCVKLDHLSHGTRLDNVTDAVRKGRMVRGQRSPHAKLTDEQADHIRRVYRSNIGVISVRDLAWLFSVSSSRIIDIINNRSY